MVSLLPPLQDIKLHYRRHVLDERTALKYDAVIVVCVDRDTTRFIKQLPHAPHLAAVWRKSQAVSCSNSATSTLQLCLPNANATALTVGFAKDSMTPFVCLTLAGKLVKEAKLQTHQNVAITTLGFAEPQKHMMLEALLAATLAAAAPLPEFKSKPARDTALRSITILHTGVAPDYSVTVATHAGNHLARWLTSLPPNHLHCASYAQTLKALARRCKWRYSFSGEAQLKRAGAGAFLAVSRANAHRGAGIVKLSYRPKLKASLRANKNKPNQHITLVGKGICFDTGGINLKSHKSMYHMHEDMQGSAVAVGTLLALTQLSAPFNVDCWLALTENEIGPQAYRPQEVVTAANGVTIQVVHSDAEGRMALADTLALASRDQPHTILDFATLTGACVGALTERMSGVFTNRSEWRSGLEQAGHDSGERVWNFPMDEDYDSDLDSPVADILQCTPDSKGDHILAARFLARFVAKDIGWVHVDLAASNRPGGLAHIPSDCTGFGVRFAVEWLLHHRDARQGTQDQSE